MTTFTDAVDLTAKAAGVGRLPVRGVRLRRAGGEQARRRERAVAVRPDDSRRAAERAVPRARRGRRAEVGRRRREGRGRLSRLQAGAERGRSSA